MYVCNWIAVMTPVTNHGPGKSNDDDDNGFERKDDNDNMALRATMTTTQSHMSKGYFSARERAVSSEN